MVEKPEHLFNDILESDFPTKGTSAHRYKKQAIYPVRLLHFFAPFVPLLG